LPRPGSGSRGGEPLIRLRGLSKTFAVGGTPVHALRDVDLDIASGEFCSVMGPSGAGKSTLMNVLGCIEAPDTGSYWLDGESVGALGDRALARVRNRSIGIVFQSFNLLPAMNAMENVELPLVYAGVRAAERRRRAIESLERVGLGQRQQHVPAQLSGGERQRVAIARALVVAPRIVLADEPTGNLDSNTATEILNLLASIHADGNTVICVTHDSEVARHAGRILEVLDGRVHDDSAVRQ
jgi:putative ABC transport system ATP-binding protein